MMNRDRSASDVSTHNVGSGNAITFKTIDALVAESNSFLGQLSPQNTSSTGDIPLPVAKRFFSWRAKRRDEKLLLLFEALYPRIRQSEEYLRDMLNQIVERKLALRDQAKHLLSRLESCILYNSEAVNSLESTIEELRTLVSNLSFETSVVKSMVSFNAELVRQRVVQSLSRGRMFVNWGSRAVMMRPISDQELNEDPDHPNLMRRLTTLREYQQQIKSRLQNLLEERETHRTNLESCLHATSDLTDLLRKSGGEDVTSEYVFDHAHCDDCTCVFSIASECDKHLKSLMNQSTEASQRLLLLVEIRERVRECGELLMEEGGSTSFDESHVMDSTSSAAVK